MQYVLDDVDMEVILHRLVLETRETLQEGYNTGMCPKIFILHMH